MSIDFQEVKYLDSCILFALNEAQRHQLKGVEGECIRGHDSFYKCPVCIAIER